MTDRAPLGHDGILTEDALVSYVRSQRWYGAQTRAVQGVTVVDRVPMGGEGSPSLALVELTFETGGHELYQLLLEEDDGTVVDATGSPALADRLVRLLADRATVEGGDGRVEFNAIRPVTAPDAAAEQSADVDASNTVAVVDGLLVKTYRRLRPGLHPELEMLLFFAEHQFQHVPQLVGWYDYVGERVHATLGLVQGLVPDARDGWQLGLEELATAPERFSARLDRLGTVVGQMHAVLGVDGADPAFAPEEATPEANGLLVARIEEEIDTTFDTFADHPAFEPLAGRRADVHQVLAGLAPSGAAGRTIRTHGDLHLGQVLAHDDDWTIIDFEGEPARATSARRQKAPALRDVAGMLRSFSYLVTLSREEGAELGDDWEAEMRQRFLDPYRASGASTVLPSSVEMQDHQLMLFELEKAFYEVRYELDHRPERVGIPVAGITSILERAVA